MQTVFLTGGSRGIGLELARQLSSRGDRVIAASRTCSDELAEVVSRHIELDLCDDDAVAKLADQVEEPIDLLINNAGYLKSTGLQELRLDEVRKQWEINALGPLKVTSALSERLVDGGTVAMLTSRMGSVADNTSGGHYGYRMSKAALNMAGMSLAHDLRPRGIRVVLLHPGFVKTDMTGGRGNWGPAEAAASLIERIDEQTLDDSGRFVHANGEQLPW
jgi:NAD(P)-dependent dehydrogenase (short-subunit alcohol dehydrogenase family)